MIELQRVTLELRMGIKLSGQSSYSRRPPRPIAIPHLEAARAELRKLVESEPANSQAWDLLSNAEECFLNYREAIQCLEKAMALNPGSKTSQLKRLAALTQSLGFWEGFPLTPEQLVELGDYLESIGADTAAGRRSLEHTEQWLAAKDFADVDAIIEQIRQNGAFSDFQVYHNLVRG